MSWICILLQLHKKKMLTRLWGIISRILPFMCLNQKCAKA
jgi:hypothetical protein